MSASVLSASSTGAPPPVPRLKTIIARLSVSLATAIVIPGVLFTVCLVSVSVETALVSALVWCYGAVAWRMATKRRASGLLALTVTIMTVRTAIALASGDTFLYFLQPVVSDALVAVALLVSLATARPASRGSRRTSTRRTATSPFGRECSGCSGTSPCSGPWYVCAEPA